MKLNIFDIHIVYDLFSKFKKKNILVNSVLPKKMYVFNLPNFHMLTKYLKTFLEMCILSQLL